MFAPFRAFKNAVLLDEEEHQDLKIKKPENYEFMKEVEVVPLGFSELVSATMFYPVMIGVQQGEYFPFAILGINRKNVFIDENGNFKVEPIPKICQLYPFSVIKTRLEDGKEEWNVIVDLACKDENGERIFDDFGGETPFFSEVKKELTELAIDLQKASEFCKELLELNCIKSINLKINSKYGEVNLKNIYIIDIENLRKTSPEKLYYLNTSGYLPILYAIYYSVRNFKLFDLL